MYHRIRSRRLISIGSVAVLTFIVDYSYASPADVCSVVLTNKAYDTSRQSTNYQYMSATRDRLCHDEYNSVNEARSAAESAGFNLGYAGFTVGGNGATQTADGKVSIASTSFCSASSADIRTALSTSYEEQVANVAVKAWEECVKRSQENVLYISYKLRPDGSGFDGTLHLTANQGPLGRTITGIVIGGAAARVTCNIGGRSYTPDEVQANPVEIKTTGTALVCEKEGDASVSVAIQTSQGAADFIAIPSKNDILNAKLAEINNALTEVQSKVSELTNRAERMKPIKLYLCPNDRELPAKATANWVWASYGCLGQVSSTDKCMNIGWDPDIKNSQIFYGQCDPVYYYKKEAGD